MRIKEICEKSGLTDRTVYPYMLEGSAQTIKSVTENSYAPWVRV